MSRPEDKPTMAPPPPANRVASLRSAVTNLRGMASRMFDEADLDERVCRARTALKRATAHSLLAQADDIETIKAQWERV
jgi:hypothetical protein